MRNQLLLIFICFSFSSIGQLKMYILSGVIGSNVADVLFLADVESCTSDSICVLDEPLNDIAINPVDNEMYGVGDHAVYKIDIATGNMTLIVGSSLDWHGLTFSGDGTLYSTDDGHTIYKIDVTDGSYELIGPTFGYGGHDLTFYNCLLTHNTPYPDPALVQGNPINFYATDEIVFTADGVYPGKLLQGLATLGCPPLIYGVTYGRDVYRFSEDLSATVKICTDVLPVNYITGGAAAVYDETNCEFGPLGVVDMPNVFTPNSDNINDVFKPKESCGIGTYNLQILNRWGNVVFETEFRDQGWDGKIQGENAAEGTYFWVLKLTAGPDVTETTNGVLQLIR